MKKKTIYEILHCIGFLLCLFVAVVCGGDSHPLHQKTMFDSWERPQDQTEEQSTDQQVTVPQETEINDTTFSDLYETEDVTSESIETENFNELPTLVIERSESCPVKVTVTVEKQTTEHTYRMRIKFSELPKNHTFVYLLILYTDGKVIDHQSMVTQKNGNMHISYIKKEEIITFLIDGRANDSPEEEFYIDIIISNTVKPLIEPIYIDFIEKK